MAVKDRFGGSEARILDGVNASDSGDNSLDTAGGKGRSLTKIVSSGWSSMNPSEHGNGNPASAVLLLGGVGEPGAQQTDRYVLSMTYDPQQLRPEVIASGRFGFVTRDAAGRWIEAVDANTGGTATFIDGPWKPGYALGTHGVDRKHHSVWAVLNHKGAFAVG